MTDNGKDFNLDKYFETIGAGFLKATERLNRSMKGIDLTSTPLFIPEVNSLHKEFPNMEGIELPINPTYELIEKQEEANALLKNIAENTSVLKELVEINRETQLSTEELTYIVRAIREVAKAKDKEEADTSLKKAIKAINDSGEIASNIASLTTILMGIYSTVITLIN